METASLPAAKSCSMERGWRPPGPLPRHPLAPLANLAPSRPSNDVAAQHREAATSSDDGRGSKVSAVESDYRWDLLSTALPTGRAVLTLMGAFPSPRSSRKLARALNSRRGSL